MGMTYGLDISVVPIEDSKFDFKFRAFPISSVNNFPYRNHIIKEDSVKFNNSHELVDCIKKIGKFLNSDLKLFVVKNSLEHQLLKDSSLKSSIEFMGYKNKENYNNSFVESSVSYKPIKLEPVIHENSFFIDLDINTERFLKTTEIISKGFTSYNNMLSKKPLFENSIIFQNSFSSTHDNFVEFILPHILKAKEKHGEIFIHTKSKNFPYISSLNRKLQSMGINHVKQKFKTINPESENESVLRIEEHMKKVYDNLTELNNKHVVYCDGAVLNNGNLISGAFIFREEGQPDIEHNHFVSTNSKQTDQAELLALKEALTYIVENNKNDKPIHFVFDSDYIFRKLNVILFEENFEDFRLQEEFEDIKKLVEDNNLNIKTLVLKSHQIDNSKSFAHEVVKYNQKVDELTKQNVPNAYKKYKY